jgi:hypothetical protein
MALLPPHRIVVPEWVRRHAVPLVTVAVMMAVLWTVAPYLVRFRYGSNGSVVYRFRTDERRICDAVGSRIDVVGQEAGRY